MIRVLIVADIVGGVRTFTDELVSELGRRGVELHLALIGPGGGIPAPRVASCEVRDLRLEWMEEPWVDVERTAAWIERLRSELRPDLIHMNTFAPVLEESVPVMLTVHSCVLTWWRAVHGRDAPAGWDTYRQLVARSLARANVVAVPTRALLGELEQVYGSVPDARVIPNGRDVKLGVPSARGRGPLVICAARLWDEAKNAALLARTAERIDGEVILIGAGALQGCSQCLDELAEHELLRWFSRSAVFAEPARYEPFGLAALEAALCGCALVLGDIPSLREVWGDAASYVSPEDPEGFVEAVNSLLRDPLRRAAVARRAYEVARRYNPVALGDRYMACYLALASEPVAA